MTIFSQDKFCGKPLCEYQYLPKEKLPTLECTNHLENWEDWKTKRKKLFYKFYKKDMISSDGVTFSPCY